MKKSRKHLLAWQKIKQTKTFDQNRNILLDERASY